MHLRRPNLAWHHPECLFMLAEKTLPPMPQAAFPAGLGQLCQAMGRSRPITVHQVFGFSISFKISEICINF
jgi:hypothetical protein